MSSLYIIAGPNGAGKTTFVRNFLRYDFALVPAEQLTEDLIAARNRIAELDAEIAKYQRSPFSVNETPE